MMELALNRPLDAVLCLGAHADDIEIGCGGTLIKLLDAQPDASVHWVVFSAEGPRRQEAEASARSLLGKRAGAVIIESFRDGFFPQQGAHLKERFRALEAEVRPDLVFTHYGADAHQDHRTVSELTWQSFRDHLVLEYEIPKYDGDLGHPNLFVPLDDAAVARKVEHLVSHFGSQRSKHWFTEETFRALLRIRGMECRAAGGYAEAFHCRKMTLA